MSCFRRQLRTQWTSRRDSVFQVNPSALSDRTSDMKFQPKQGINLPWCTQRDSLVEFALLVCIMLASFVLINHKVASTEKMSQPSPSTDMNLAFVLNIYLASNGISSLNKQTMYILSSKTLISDENSSRGTGWISKLWMFHLTRRGGWSSDTGILCHWGKFENAAGVSTAPWNRCCAVSIVLCENWDTLWAIFCLLRQCDSTVTAPSTPLLTPLLTASLKATQNWHAAMQNLPAHWLYAEKKIQTKRTITTQRWSVQPMFGKYFYTYFSFCFFLLGRLSTGKLVLGVSRTVFKRMREDTVVFGELLKGHKSCKEGRIFF